MPRKKVDERVRTLIENGVKTHTRSFFVLVGDRGKDQVVNLHYILSKAQVKARPSVLWCYNRDLGFSTHRNKRMKKINKLKARGVFDADKEDPFDLFVSSTAIRWCYYKETQRILGNTYGMAVLQDFEAMTPNILCRTIETVEGGGVVVLLLRTMSSLKQLYTLAMDVHDRFRTDAFHDVVGRFNERFILSLASCPACLVLDDELNVLPISRHAKALKPVKVVGDAGDESDEDGGGGAGGAGEDGEGVKVVPRVTPAQAELAELKSSMASTALVGGLVGMTRTLDQAKAVLTFAEAISEKTLRSTVALTAGRGRGKSAALGLSIAAAVAYGYANIFVTSPSPENLTTLFEFVFKGLEALAYKEHLDYEAVASTNPDFNRAIVRVNVFRGHRQTVQYIEPHDADKLSQAELVVVDEAAAIPLPLVKRLLGPYLVFLASTVNGYEGTGRSLSLKLIQQLRQQQHAAGAGVAAAPATTMVAAGGGGVGGRTLREVLLSEPIRYASGDPIESWLNSLLCLDASTPYRLAGRLPAPADCDLFAVDRDTLFSYHTVSEEFLHRMMSLYVSSHYKNTPNDLQLMSDAPAHKLFVLLGPHTPDGGLPDILCVIQVCLEGRISADSLKASMARGVRAAGDLIPWALSQQFQDDGFAKLSGARVVRIATHPDATKMGYGTRALELLRLYYTGQMVMVDADEREASPDLQVDRGLHRIASPAPTTGGGGSEGSALVVEKLKPRTALPPLLVNVGDIQHPPRLHWLGVSYGLTLPLFTFWHRGGYLPVYLRQTSNDLTAEHSMIMLRPLDCSDMPATEAPRPGWHIGFVADFARRYMQLLSYEFRSFDATLALSVLDAATAVFGVGGGGQGDDGEEAEEGGDGDGGAAAGAATTALSTTSAASEVATSHRAAMKPLTYEEMAFLFTPHDLKRLESYARNVVDYHMILDLVPDLTRLYFQGRLHGVRLPRLQAGIVLGLGLQRVTVEALSYHFDIAVNQVLALFHKAVRKMTAHLVKLNIAAVEARLTSGAAATPAPLPTAVHPSATVSLSAGDLKAFAVPAGIAASPSAGVGTKRKDMGSNGSSRPSSHGGGGVTGDGELYDPRHRASGHKKPRMSGEGGGR